MPALTDYSPQHATALLEHSIPCLTVCSIWNLEDELFRDRPSYCFHPLSCLIFLSRVTLCQGRTSLLLCDLLVLMGPELVSLSLRRLPAYVSFKPNSAKKIAVVYRHLSNCYFPDFKWFDSQFFNFMKVWNHTSDVDLPRADIVIYDPLSRCWALAVSCSFWLEITREITGILHSGASLGGVVFSHFIMSSKKYPPLCIHMTITTLLWTRFGARWPYPAIGWCKSSYIQARLG